MASFSINLYDKDGDKYEYGVYIHHENTILRFETLTDFRNFLYKLNQIEKEIAENYTI